MEELSGVMSLPEAQGPGMAPDQAAIFEQIRQNVSRPEITQELLAAGEQADPQTVSEFKRELAGLELSPEELNKLNTMVDAILAAPQDYASLRRAYLAEGMPEDLLPEQFDPAFFTALNMALDTIAISPASPPPMAMAMGGVASLAAYGRNGDTMLAHITPQEAALLRRMGGAGTINPYTGLPEYFKIFKKIGNAVKKFAKSTIGKIVIGVAASVFLGPLATSYLGATFGAAATGFAASAGTTLLAGGSLKDALKAGVVGGLSAGLFQGVTQGFEGLPKAGATAAPVAPTGGALEGSGTAASQGVGTAADLARDSSIGRFAAPGTGDLGQFAMQGPGMGPTPDVIVGAPLAPRSSAVLNTGVEGGVSSAPALNTQTNVSGYDYLPRLGGDTSFSTSATSVQQPGAGQSGILDLINKGEYTKAFGTAYDRFMPEALGGQRGVVSPEMIKEAMPKAEALVLKLYPSVEPGSSTFQRLVAAEATKIATPSLLSTYGPLAAAGLGVMALGGGFKAEQPQMPEAFKQPTGYQRYFSYPELYRLQYGGIRPTSYGGIYTPPGYAMGGGVMDTPQAMRVGGNTYPRKTGPINGPGTGTSDSIPAMLSDGEFVFTAKAVRAMGNGSRRKGAKKMYKLMKMLEGKMA